MKVTYWYARNTEDANCYSVRAKTKKECVAEVAKRPHGDFDAPVKITVEYKDGFDLLTKCLSEGGVE